MNSWLTAIKHNIAGTHLKSAQPKQAALVFTSSKYHKDSLVALEHTKQKCRIKQALDRKIAKAEAKDLYVYLDI